MDTHKESHTAAVLDATGRLLGTASFATTLSGYATLLAWLTSFGGVIGVGVEGTGSYGAGLTRFLLGAGIAITEINRPNRQARRRYGKSDPADAVSAARALLAGDALGQPKTQDGPVEIIRLLRLERRSAIKARSQAVNQLHAVVAAAPERLREQLRTLSMADLTRLAGRWRVTASEGVEGATRSVLHGLACRWIHLDAEIRALDRRLGVLVQGAAPALLALTGVGTDVAGTLLVAAGDNPERLTDERAFAALCGVSPIDASSGRQQRHRLNRGGNREANRALWVIALVRLRCDARTRVYAARRLAEGRTKPEILRCLKRYIAREVFKLLPASTRGHPSIPSATVA